MMLLISKAQDNQPLNTVSMKKIEFQASDFMFAKKGGNFYGANSFQAVSYAAFGKNFEAFFRGTTFLESNCYLGSNVYRVKLRTNQLAQTRSRWVYYPKQNNNIKFSPSVNFLTSVLPITSLSSSQTNFLYFKL